MDRRLCANEIPGASKKPSSSGPRCVVALCMRRNASASFHVKPLTPHILVARTDIDGHLLDQTLQAVTLLDYAPQFCARLLRHGLDEKRDRFRRVVRRSVRIPDRVRVRAVDHGSEPA